MQNVPNQCMEQAHIGDSPSDVVDARQSCRVVDMQDIQHVL